MSLEAELEVQLFLCLEVPVRDELTDERRPGESLTDTAGVIRRCLVAEERERLARHHRRYVPVATGLAVPVLDAAVVLRAERRVAGDDRDVRLSVVDRPVAQGA